MNQHTKLNLEAMREVYVEHSSLTSKQFDDIVDGTRRINELDLGGVVWHVPNLARDLHLDIPARVHTQAWAAGWGLPWTGIEDFYERAIAAGLLPPWLLNRTEVRQRPAKTQVLTGRLLVQLGFVSIFDLQRALGIQALIRDELGLIARIGRILSAITPLSIPDFLQAISMQLGIDYVSLEKTMPEVERVITAKK